MIDVAIIGGGAAGFFAAINIKMNCPTAKVVILEKTTKTLSKVKVSGGGRCNVTHNCESYSELASNYPRGAKFLKPLFKEFGVPETINWFENNGVKLTTEVDGRMFPISNTSETIVNLFESKVKSMNIDIDLKSMVTDVISEEDGTFKINLQDISQPIHAKFIILAAGGMNKNDSGNFLKNFNISTVNGVPSLFTFNIKNEELATLAGVSVERGKIKIAGLKQPYHGPILITHWGLSGPAVLKSSAWYARDLFDKLYQFDCLVSWLPIDSEAEALSVLENIFQENPKRQLNNLHVLDLPNRLWQYILLMAKVDPVKRCMETKKVELNRILENLIRMPFSISGKTTFKEEFVTAGGINLDELNPSEMSLKNYPNIYAIGEMIDVDGVTGGFNFQAAWTTAWFAAQSISRKII